MRSTLKFLLAVSSIRLVYRYLLPKWDYQSQLNRLPFILELIIATLTHTHTKKRGKEKNRWQFLPTNNLHGKENLLSDHRPLFHANNFIIYSSLSFDSQHVFSTSNQSRTTCCTRGKKEKKKITSTFVRKNFVRPPTGYKTTLWSKKKKKDGC